MESRPFDVPRYLSVLPLFNDLTRLLPGPVCTLHLADLVDAELPAPLRRDFGELKAALSRIAPVGNESRVRASVQKMSPDEAASHAATIVKIYVELMNVERAEPLKVVTAPRKPSRILTGRP